MFDPFDRSQTSGILAEAAAAAAFLTRIPAHVLHVDPQSRPNFRIAARTFPIVGFGIGVFGGAILLLGNALHLPAWVAAILAVGLTIVLTGGLHEDGLADTADGFGGGKTVASRLEIMRDSRIGTFGALALILSVMLRVSLLAALLPFGIWQAVAAIVAAETVGRAAIVHLWAALPPARPDGLAASMGRPSTDTAWAAVIVALAVALVACGLGIGPVPAVVACLAAALATYGFEALCRKMTGGQTGDMLGAAEQLSGIAFLLALVAFH